jgi:eukaryotic-like serine/threonine-protein kinase
VNAGLLELSSPEYPVIQALLPYNPRALHMTLSPGTRVGPYEVVSAIGAGGMGEVYKARDTRLKRDVALKVLPASVAADPERVWRFEQEARAAAAISHRNVTAIHDVGRHGDVSFIVSELLEGETLRTRLQSGPMAARKAVDIAIQIAEGLAAAHDRGVVHRDLKPENVFLASDGQVKILDFGLAKLSEPDSTLPTSPALPTGIHATAQGVVLGTVGYMAPEQVRGDQADHRADLFATGVVLYEMITGTRAFDRATAVETMTAILNDEPASLTMVDKDLSPGLAQIVAHCIAKRPQDRFQSARDLAFALQAVASVSPDHVVDHRRVGGHVYRRRVAMTIAGITLTLAGVAIGRAIATRSSDVAAPRPVFSNFSQLTTQPGEERSVRVSPDGRSFLYVSDSAGNPDIFLQRIGGHNPLNLTSDSPARDTEPAFSPDGNLIGFRSERNGGGIFLMGATGESVRRLTDFGFAADWAPDGKRIVVSTEPVVDPYYRESSDGEPGLWIVEVPGGSRKQLLKGHALQPRWSPDGRWIVFWAYTALDSANPDRSATCG